jgi:hypothetical protein
LHTKKRDDHIQKLFPKTLIEKRKKDTKDGREGREGVLGHKEFPEASFLVKPLGFRVPER